ncbi:YeiH family protein [Pseudomonas benzenivorans]|uniref:YeiH family protein n=1 Tax=Pseudomonas benzenivorans TaxID=556533 RepID=A0ABY5H6W9_9PSED|nr:YeiH family protein [Pseudomonas benzenivorans]UTW07353.1 YeiH family protein [Pseudomonas benzenivorans]
MSLLKTKRLSNPCVGLLQPIARRLETLVPGLLFSGAIAALAVTLSNTDWFRHNGLSALTLAIVLGMLIGNTLYPRTAEHSGAGVTFAKQKLLRLGIILYGFQLTFQDIAQVGVAGVLVDALVLGSTFVLAWFAGTRLFKLDRTTTILIGAGSSICGAAAVMATEPVVRARAEQVTVAVSTVVVFGTLAMFLYPALYQLNQSWQFIPGGAAEFGIFTGATIHEVAQVVAAGRAIGPEAADTAVIAKMIRVMLLAPFLVILSIYLAKQKTSTQACAGEAKTKICTPWFAYCFVLVAGLNSLAMLPESVVTMIRQLDLFLLAMAMAALGLTTHVSAIRRAGIKPLLLAALLFAWLVLGGAGIMQVATHL